MAAGTYEPFDYLFFIAHLFVAVVVAAVDWPARDAHRFFDDGSRSG